MNDGALSNCRILVVEDEYLLAIELSARLVAQGAVVIGPVGSVEDAIALIDTEVCIDAAVLDVNLQGEKVFPVADRLTKQGIPFLFATGYDSSVTPVQFERIARFEKPIDIWRSAGLSTK